MRGGLAVFSAHGVAGHGHGGTADTGGLVSIFTCANILKLGAYSRESQSSEVDTMVNGTSAMAIGQTSLPTPNSTRV